MIRNGWTIGSWIWITVAIIELFWFGDIAMVAVCMSCSAIFEVSALKTKLGM